MLHFALAVSSTLAMALAWGVYFFVKDRYEPEPRRLLVVVFLLGACSTVFALGLHLLLDLAGWGESLLLSGHPLALAMFCLLVGGVLEELCKFSAVQVLIGRHPAFNEHVDGLIYSAVGALGFATAENIILASHLEGPELWGRIIASPLTHALFAMVWGMALSLDKFARPRHPVRVTLGLAAAMVLHGLYDFLVLSSDWGPPWAAGLVLVLWIAFFLVLASFLKRSPFRPA